MQFENDGTNGTIRNEGATIFRTGGSTERMRIDSSGNVGIGTTNPGYKLQVEGTGFYTGQLTIAGFASDSGISFRQGFTPTNTGIRAKAIGTANRDGVEVLGYNGIDLSVNNGANVAMRIVGVTGSGMGNVGIGTTSPGYKLEVNGNSYFQKGMVVGSTTDTSTTPGLTVNLKSGSENIRLADADAIGSGFGPYMSFYDASAAATRRGFIQCLEDGSEAKIKIAAEYGGFEVWTGASNNEAVRLTINSSGTATFSGAVSKASGSFRIDHPLEAKKDTHQLVHSFVEGPQADLIYRGKVDLVDGEATVNIDTAADMSEGTFVALNTDVQCFTTNESNWDLVKGSVSGNILTIESKNTSSTATISWMVIGERHDQHMKDTDWTDSDGKVIVEPLKTDNDKEESPAANI